MHTIVSLLWQAPNRITDRFDALFHAPFWKVTAGAVIVTLSLFAWSVLPSDGRDKIKLAAVLGALAFVALDLVWAFEPGSLLG